MKRIFGFLLLCALVLLLAPPLMAEEDNESAKTEWLQHQVDNVSTVTISDSIKLTKEIIITKGVTIDGDNKTITAPANSRSFKVAAGSLVTIKNMIITGGHVTITEKQGDVFKNPGGGGMLIQDTSVDLENVSFDKNGVVTGSTSASSTANDKGWQYHSIGGGLSIVASKEPITVNIVSCNFTDNSCDVYGGGIAALSGHGKLLTLNMSGTSLKDNLVRDTGDGEGGGLYLGSHAAMTSTDRAPNVSNIYGGHEDAYGGDHPSKVNATIVDCKFSGNSARIGGGLAAHGLYFSSSDITLLVKDTDFTNNAASNDANTGGLGWGGGISAWIIREHAKMSLDIEGCSFDRNISYLEGGGVSLMTDLLYTGIQKKSLKVNAKIANSAFINNKAGVYSYGSDITNRRGGGLAVWACDGPISIDVVNSAFNNNKAPGSGGAIQFWAYYGNMLDANVDGCSFTGNTAGAQGGAIYNWSSHYLANNTDYRTNVLNVTTKNSVFANNHAKTYGGAISNHAHGNSSSATTNNTEGSNNIDLTNTISNEIVNCTFVDNSADISYPEIVNSADKFYYKDYANKGTNTCYYGTISTDIINSIIYNAKSDKTIGRSTTEAASFDLTNTAYSGDLSKIVAESKDNIAITTDDFAAAKSNTSTDITVNGVTHKVFLLTSSDTKLKASGTTVGAPKTDILGATRSTTAPSLGAVEYVGVVITSTDLPAATYGVEYSVQLSADFTPKQGEDAGFSWTATDLPEWLKLSDDGILHGTPTETGSFEFNATATGTGVYENYSATDKFSLTVGLELTSLDVEITSSDGLSLTADVGKSASMDLAALVSGDYHGKKISLTDGQYELKWSTASTDIASFDSAKLTVALTSDYAIGTYRLPITATATSGDVTGTASDFVTLKVLNVAPVLSVTSSSITAARGAEVSTTITATEGTANLTWTASGKLPDGLAATSSDATATISGTISRTAALGEHTYTFTASNDVGKAEQAVAITVVDEAPVLGSSTYSFSAPKGRASSIAVTATAGTGLSWSLSGQPSWLSLTSSDDGMTATISGTAPLSEAAGSKTFTLTASNTTETAATAQVTVKVTGSIANSDGSYTEYEEGDVYYASPSSRNVIVNSNGNVTSTSSTVIRNAGDQIILSADVAITLESTDLLATVSESFSAKISIDVTLDVNTSTNYSEYSYTFEIDGLPDTLEISGDVSGSGDVDGASTLHYDFEIYGVPEESGDYDMLASFTLLVSGDVPAINAYGDMDMNLSVSAEPEPEVIEFENDSVDVKITENEDGTIDVQLTVKDTEGGSGSDGGYSLLDVLNSLTPEERQILQSNTIGTLPIPEGVSDLTGLNSLNVIALDLQDATSLANADLTGNTSVRNVTATGNKTLTTLNIALSQVETVNADNSAVSTLNVAGNEHITTISLNSTMIGNLDTKGCKNLTSVEAKNCPEVTTVDTSGCDQLQSLDVTGSGTTSLNASGCTSLVSLECGECNITEFNIDGCENLEVLNFQGNGIIRADLISRDYPKLRDTRIGGQRRGDFNRSFIRGGRFSFRNLFNGRVFNSEISASDEESLATEDTEETITQALANVTEVKARNASGDVKVTYDETTGEMTFSDTPTSFSYVYLTGAATGDNMDVTITADPDSQSEEDFPGPGESHSGGCGAFGFGMMSMMTVVAFFFKKL